MVKFDPLKEREILLSNTGVRRQLAYEFENDRANGWLTSHGNAFIGSAIECILTGLEQPAVWLLEESHRWLTAGIEENEESPIYCALRNEWLAECKWLLAGVHDAENLRESRRRTEELDGPWAGEATEELDGPWTGEAVELCLPKYCDAGEFARACEIFESCSGREKPADLSEINDGGSMAYVICAHRLGPRVYQRRCAGGGRRVSKAFRARSPWARPSSRCCAMDEVGLLGRHGVARSRHGKPFFAATITCLA